MVGKGLTYLGLSQLQLHCLTMCRQVHTNRSFYLTLSLKPSDLAGLPWENDLLVCTCLHILRHRGCNWGNRRWVKTILQLLQCIQLNHVAQPYLAFQQASSTLHTTPWTMVPTDTVPTRFEWGETTTSYWQHWTWMCRPQLTVHGETEY